MALPAPPYVITEAQKDRWQKAVQVAEAVSMRLSPDAEVDIQFTWRAARVLYNSDIPSDGPLEEALPEEAWAVIGESLDALEALAGRSPHSSAAFERLHPRDRLGHWRRTLGLLLKKQKVRAAIPAATLAAVANLLAQQGITPEDLVNWGTNLQTIVSMIASRVEAGELDVRFELIEALDEAEKPLQIADGVPT